MPPGLRSYTGLWPISEPEGWNKGEERSLTRAPTARPWKPYGEEEVGLVEGAAGEFGRDVPVPVRTGGWPARTGGPLGRVPVGGRVGGGAGRRGEGAVRGMGAGGCCIGAVRGMGARGCGMGAGRGMGIGAGRCGIGIGAGMRGGEGARPGPRGVRWAQAGAASKTPADRQMPVFRPMRKKEVCSGSLLMAPPFRLHWPLPATAPPDYRM
jgi:hypothetical protein